MYAAYIDDSGTDPKQPIAIASALILPAKKVPALEGEWATFLHKEDISEFHTSECVAHNRKSDFANWDDKQVDRVVARVRQIIRKYSVRSYSISIDKDVYDSVIPADLRRVIGKYHYTWAVDQVCGFIRDWGRERNVPMEYVFDNIDQKSQRPQRQEIERVMEHGEALHPGLFVGHYSFRNRKDLPVLQCADLFAWTCYQRSISHIRKKPVTPLAEVCWEQFSTWKHGGEDWCGAWFATKAGLLDWVRRVHADKEEMARINKLP